MIANNTADAFCLVSGMNNVTKHIMNNFVILSQISAMMEVYKLEEENTDYRVSRLLRQVQGICDGTFIHHGSGGVCSLYGQPKAFASYGLDSEILAIISDLTGVRVDRDHAFHFRRARVEAGIFARGSDDASGICRNESIVMDRDGVVIFAGGIVGIVNVSCSELTGTFLYGWKMEQPESDGSIPSIGTKSVQLPHIFCVRKGATLRVCATDCIERQMVILCKDLSTGNQLVSPPSNLFMPT